MAAPRLVIFDCDGVLIDSEPVVNRLVAAELTALGWPMTAEECCARFLGLDVEAMIPLIEQALGRKLPPAWNATLIARIITVLKQEAPMVPGAREVLAATSALGLPWRVASNSSHAEMEAKFGGNGLLPLVAGRLHSFTDVPRGKPAPDLFLAAATAEGVSPGDCIVVEDSVPGARAARAAGMRCFGLCRNGVADGLIAEGAQVVRSLFELPALLRSAVAAAA